MSLKDHLVDTGTRGSDHEGSHTQTHIVENAPESDDADQGKWSGDPRTAPSSEYAQHAHAGDTGTGSGQISPQTQNEPSTDPASGSVENLDGAGNQAKH